MFGVRRSNFLSRRVSLLNYARGVHIKTESTPNHLSVKFIPDVPVLGDDYSSGIFFERRSSTSKKEDHPNSMSLSKSPLAKMVLQVDGVKSVFLGKDFITVTKVLGERWSILKPLIYSQLLEFFSSGEPVIYPNDYISDTTVLESDSEVVATIKELLETRIRPAVQEDGGDIHFVDFDENTGIVRVRLAGSCVGCSSSSITLKNGVENMLTHYIPEVKSVEEVPSEEELENNKLTFEPQPVSVDSETESQLSHNSDEIKK